MILRTSNRAGKSIRFDCIDAMRGVACLAVLVAHCASDIAVNFHASALRSHFQRLFIDDFETGRFGVVLFFLISGYVVPYSLKGGEPLTSFARARFFRLYPMFWVGMSLALVEGALLEHRVIAPAMFAANLTMLPRMLGQPFVTGIYWTLELELYFYAACALLHARGLLRNALALTALALGILAVPVVGLALRLTGHHAPYLYYVGMMPVMFAGTLLRKWHLDGKTGAGLMAFAVLAATIAAAHWFSLQPDHLATISTPRGATRASLAAVGVFLAGIVIPLRPPRWLVGCGYISYSVYLLHDTIVKVISHAMADKGDIAMIELYLSVTAVTLILSTLGFRLIEQPAIALGRMRPHPPLPAAAGLANAGG